MNVHVQSLWHGLIRRPLRIPHGPIIAEVAVRHGLKPEDLIGPSLNRTIGKARNEAISEVLDRTGRSSPAVGRIFGGRHHTTILAARKRHAQRTVSL